MTEFKFYTDPGHGWLEVPMHDMRDVGLNPFNFSTCSYRRRNVFYLEEDCDAPKFIHAYDRKYGAKPTVVDVHTDHDSFIRSLPPIK